VPATEQEAEIAAHEQEITSARYNFQDMCEHALHYARFKSVFSVTTADPKSLLEKAGGKMNAAMTLVENGASPFDVAKACADGANYFMLAQYVYLSQVTTKAIAVANDAHVKKVMDDANKQA
jgi:hypothetical protein